VISWASPSFLASQSESRVAARSVSMMFFNAMFCCSFLSMGLENTVFAGTQQAVERFKVFSSYFDLKKSAR
jgi:hypothetical protein